ncbi:MAG: hypothetical protein LBC74_04585, partial [Planctomycetaceae bacterium]|nr:hypothetical protein [Planctomycetaceae bacterium]
MRIGYITIISILTIFVIILATFYCVEINEIKSISNNFENKHKLFEPIQSGLSKVVVETEASLAAAEKKIIDNNAALNKEHLKQSARIAGDQIKLQLQELVTAAETLANINSIQKNSIERKSRSTNPNSILIIPAVKQNYYQEVAFRTLPKKRQSNSTEQKRTNTTTNQIKQIQNIENKTKITKLKTENINQENNKIVADNIDEVVVIPSDIPNYFIEPIQPQSITPTAKIASNFIVTKNQTESNPTEPNPIQNKKDCEDQKQKNENAIETQPKTKTEIKPETKIITSENTSIIKFDIDWNNWDKIEKGIGTNENNNPQSKETKEIKEITTQPIIIESDPKIEIINDLIIIDGAPSDPQDIEPSTDSEPKKDTAKPETKTEIVKPETKTEIVKPETKTEIAKPETKTEIVKPETKTEIVKTETKTEIVKPETKTEIVKPETKTEIVKPETKTEIVKPETKTEIVKPETK